MASQFTANPKITARVYERLKSGIKDRDDLLRLFVKDLGYERVEQPIPATKDVFGAGAVLELAQQCRPLRLACQARFEVLYTELAGDRLDYARQRSLATKLLETFPDALFVFVRASTLGDAGGAEIHLLNVKATDGKIFRRFKLGPGERYRTTAERLSLIEAADPALGPVNFLRKRRPRKRSAG